jgi:hypothetical protein
MVGTRGLPACSLSPSHHPTHNCHINSLSDTILILLNSCSNTFSDTHSLRKQKTSPQLRLAFWGCLTLAIFRVLVLSSHKTLYDPSGTAYCLYYILQLSISMPLLTLSLFQLIFMCTTSHPPRLH